ncbi:asparagine synthase (glutamine-hydrolyzing) [Mesorhizobium sp.]|uniref:asparagine synthase (glutamine-hydrolyzing) n=1 Tax=Mesorhizobium sp. TaxID=1871066 RepID=UPI000FEA1B00|nr:asparagine synthase (glutamine-hydrolyzing) [Mesorhizobium sp.]RWE78628.1 MAG: asparagine synthase (glutamine-hydrolyzing) [Mesorhizobium sp.]TIV33050.1 MAG: asparagine synthase (glutamine-hydrolyzing) [Mesorhizobium sp.]
MCGIAGILVAPEHMDANSLRPIGHMTSSLRHRGPDGQGLWIDRDAGIALGHRRLAIVDLSSTGQQPMRSASGRYIISFNGEIYNFRDLRRQLEDAGCEFHGTGDTEVLLCAVELWGLEAAVKRLAGMFAFALWDLKTRTLHLARDRVGKKPLYVALAGGALLFASELKAIRCFPSFSAEIDLEAAEAMLSQGWVPDQACIWRNAFKLPPGSFLSVKSSDLAKVVSAGSLAQRVDHWWSLAEVASIGRAKQIVGADDDLTNELDDLLRLAVRERMIADVPLGGFLSGGIDSSAVVALMQAQSASPVRTFTIAFGEGGFDESGYAAEVARHLGTDHTQLQLSPDAALDVIPELPRVWDEPFADESQLPTLLVARLARQYVTVALSGDGGDECFAGYGRHFMADWLRRRQQLPFAVRRTMATGLNLLARAAREDMLRRLPLGPGIRHMLRSDRLKRISGLMGARHEDDLYQRLVTPPTANLTRRGHPIPAHSIPKLDGLLSRLLYDDMAGYLPGDILVKLDRATMANGLEGRCPLLDHRVIEFAWRLPSNAKVRDGKGKWILRNLLRRYVPDRLIERPKQGFDVPVSTWLRGSLRNWATDLMADIRHDGDEVLDSSKVDRCWRNHMQGQDCSRELWSALMFQAWRNETRKTPWAAHSRQFDMAGV